MLIPGVTGACVFFPCLCELHPSSPVYPHLPKARYNLKSMALDVAALYTEYRQHRNWQLATRRRGFWERRVGPFKLLGQRKNTFNNCICTSVSHPPNTHTNIWSTKQLQIQIFFMLTIVVYMLLSENEEMQ